MFMQLIFVVSLTLLSITSESSNIKYSNFGKNTSSCTGTPNTLPIITDEPRFIKSVNNGKLYSIDGNGLISPSLSIAHIWGTPYEMGYAYGELLSDQITSLLNKTMEYFESQIEEYLPFLEPQLRDKIAQDGVDSMLDAVYDLAYPFIPERYIQEMQGLADGTGNGITYKDVYRVTMIPEAIKASCTMAGAWGDSVSNDYTLVQLRALDWDTNGPFQEYPLLLIYHPSEEGHDFSVLTWSGLIGAITGYGNSDLGICEKVWLSYNGKDNRLGIPFTFVLRDILQFDSTNEEAISRIKNSKRTCSIWVGLGDSQSNEMNILQYSFENSTVYTSNDFPYYPPNHPYIKDIIYVDKHVQPSYNPCLYQLLDYNYGNITSYYMFQNVAAQLETGDMHIAVYDYINRFMYVSNAEPYNINGTQKFAYQRPFIRLNMQNLFDESPP